jgi:hypothetical protein
MDNVLTAVRMIDVFFVPPPSDVMKNYEHGDPLPPGATVVKFNVIVSLRADVGYNETHNVQLRMFNMRSEWVDLGEPVEMQFAARVNGAPAVAGFFGPVSIAVRNLGNVQISAFVQDQEVARTTLTFTPQPESPA